MADFNNAKLQLLFHQSNISKNTVAFILRAGPPATASWPQWSLWPDTGIKKEGTLPWSLQGSVALQTPTFHNCQRVKPLILWSVVTAAPGKLTDPLSLKNGQTTFILSKAFRDPGSAFISPPNLSSFPQMNSVLWWLNSWKFSSCAISFPSSLYHLCSCISLEPPDSSWSATI